MTDEKEPSKEALAVAQHIEVPYEGMADVNFALALDAWGEALLKRQEQAELQVFVDFKRDLAAEKAAHAATRAELEATRKDLAMSREELDRAHSIIAAHVDAAESLRKPLEGYQRELGEALGMMHEPDSGPTWPASWEALLDGVRARVADHKRRVDRECDEAARKPLEGELTEDVDAVREALWESSEKAQDAFGRIHAALRARGEPQAADPAFRTEYQGYMVNERGEQVPAGGLLAGRMTGEPPEPRPIVVGSKVRCFFDGSMIEGTVLRVDSSAIPYLVEYYVTEPVRRETWADDRSVAWLSDPPATPAPEPETKLVEQAQVTEPGAALAETPDRAQFSPGLLLASICRNCGRKRWDHYSGPFAAPGSLYCSKYAVPVAPAPAPELPRKVEPGTTLTVGARYRITEIAPRDRTPKHKVGEALIARDAESDVSGLDVRWFSDERQWFASDGYTGTYVTGLELVADAPKGESK